MNQKIRSFQISLLKLYHGYLKLDNALASHKPLTPMLNATPFIERSKRKAKREMQQLKQHIKHLERYAYIERVEHGNQRLYKLTSRGKFEVLRLRLVEHLLHEKGKKWDGVWRVMIFDIPEERRRYRDFMRRLLKDNGFQMWQFSVWVTKYNPEPALRNLLKYLGLHNYYSIVEAHSKQCSPQLARNWSKMRRKRDE